MIGSSQINKCLFYIIKQAKATTITNPLQTFAFPFEESPVVDTTSDVVVDVATIPLVVVVVVVEVGKGMRTNL